MTTATSRLLASLSATDRAHPTARKRLVGPDVNFGRELLVAHARATGGWIGWEAATVRTIADALAFVPLSGQGVRPARDVEIGALVNQALERAIDGARVGAGFAALARGLGFRRALRDTLLELRTAGVTAAEVRASAATGSPAYQLPAVLEEYERLLHEASLADPARVLRAALDHFEAEAPYVLDGVVALVPGLALGGLAGELIARLRERPSTMVLDADAPVGVSIPDHVLGAGDTDAPRFSPLAWAQSSTIPMPDEPAFDSTLVTVDLFAGATPSEELREVLRRAVAEGLRWDEVEIVATDPDTYGIALDALTQQLGIGATMLQGVPLARTRIGRAIDRWLAWLEDGLPADVLRQALEAGELHLEDSEVPATALARELRSLRVGWGRARYEAAVRRLESGERTARMTPREDESDEELAERRAARARVSAALAALLRALLAATPTVPERGVDRPVRSSCAELARATLAFLDLTAAHDAPELQTMDRLKQRLTDLAEVEESRGSFAGALAALRDALSEVRSWPLVTSERKPWSAEGGMPHLTDLAHAGATGRRRTFVVGLDADRTGGPARQDPLLPDGVRRAIDARSSGRLATSVARRERAAYQLGAALAGLRGKVTLSYATSGTLDGREAGPSPVLLQAWRVQRGDASLSYEQLREHLSPPACAVPNVRGASSASAVVGGTNEVSAVVGGTNEVSAVVEGASGASAVAIDARDVWLDAIADGALLLDATDAVRESFPMLAAGLDAHGLVNGDQITPHHGLVPEAGPELDPTTHPDREISPSSLEKLAACPLSWFYRYGLALHPPDDPEYDAERWLTDLDRGSLLHEVFETFAKEFAERQDELEGDGARARILAIADETIARWREDVPPPGEVVFEAEAQDLRRDALAFLEMERALRASGDSGRWLAFELAFGSGSPVGTFALPDGRTLAVRGKADRVDELPDGTLRVVDYKTGRSGRFARGGKKAPFDGGRQLQPALYAAAVETLLDGKEVSRFEYRFPTEKGENEVVTYGADELEAARGLVGELLDHVRRGEFVPTTECADCSWCDYKAVCRASKGDWGTRSPLAEWAEEKAPNLAVYVPMLARRAPKGNDA